MYATTIGEQNCGTKLETHDIQICISTKMTNDCMLWPSGHQQLVEAVIVKSKEAKGLLHIRISL